MSSSQSGADTTTPNAASQSAVVSSGKSSKSSSHSVIAGRTASSAIPAIRYTRDHRAARCRAPSPERGSSSPAAVRKLLPPRMTATARMNGPRKPPRRSSAASRIARQCDVVGEALSRVHDLQDTVQPGGCSSRSSARPRQRPTKPSRRNTMSVEQRSTISDRGDGLEERFRDAGGGEIERCHGISWRRVFAAQGFLSARRRSS